MAMKRCPECNEKFSDTYKRCPFCEEKRRIVKGKRIQRRGVKNGSRVAGTDRENVLTLVLLVILLVLAGILLWLLFGGGSESGGQGGASSVIQSGDVSGSGNVSSSGSGEASGSGSGASSGSGEASGSGSGEASGSGGSSMPEVDPPPAVDDIKKLPKTLSLSNEDYTTSVGDVDVTLRVVNGSGTYTWVSANPAVATVDANGKVTAVGSGNVLVYVTDGVGMGSCIVRVKGGSAPSGGGTGNSGGSTGSSAAGATLNKEDMTLSVGELWPLKVRGYTGEVTWSVADPTVASVLSDGTVKGLKAGRTTVTAKVGDRTLKCIVRVKN